MSTASPRRVLIVDDSSLMRRLISEIVESDPDLCVVDVAENGRVALQKVRQHKPDCVLLDLEMPELSGLDTLRRLGLRSAAKIVILSHLGDEGPLLRADAFRLGAVDVIDKPTGAGSHDLRATRGNVIRQTLRRVLGLPAVEVPDEQLSLGGATTNASVLSIEVDGLESLCERVEAAPLISMINDHFAAVEAVMRKHDGVMDSYVGGTTLATFGIPRRRPDHAARAVAAASEVLATLAARRTEGGDASAPFIEFGITVVTGFVFAGELGPPGDRRYRTMGGASERVARLGRLCQGYGAGLVVCERTLAALADRALSRRLDVVQLEAEGEPITLYEVVSGRSTVDDGALAAYARGLALYEAGHFANAIKAFDEALRLWPLDRAAARLRSRCLRLLRERSATWRGVWLLDGVAG
jgi:CheY-like chemotaxis protein